jgi:predicted transcriptional regulator
MKTAISIPDDVFTQADALARSTGRSRSELYSLAVREYVARHSSDSVTAALDAMADADLDAGFATSVGTSRLSDSEW